MPVNNSRSCARRHTFEQGGRVFKQILTTFYAHPVWQGISRRPKQTLSIGNFWVRCQCSRLLHAPPCSFNLKPDPVSPLKHFCNLSVALFRKSHSFRVKPPRQILITKGLNMSVHDLKRKLCFAFLTFIAGSGLTLIAAPAHAQQADDVVVTQSKRTAYRVAGWEHNLVRTNPNLSQFYWDPQTRYTQMTSSRRTGKGAQPVGLPIHRTNSSMKCKTAPLPENHRAQFSAEEMATRTAVSANVRFKNTKGQLASAARGSTDDCFGVLSYGNNGDSAYGQTAGGSSRSQKLSVKAQIYGKGKN